MMKIIIATLTLLAVAVFGYEHEHHDYHSHPSYKFEYGVKDPHTGDHKSQWEHRDGDVVKGAYTLHEADGTERVVEYSSDKHNGFQAHVKRVGHAHHPEVYGHHEEGHSYGGHGHGHASSYANGNLYQHHH
ncbi:AGAP006857-PA-like protein [Anopheles sinensis]|uniref:AGAP006857-PA-like protein n=1 Tax=Anopheles sinensis TaxID=74873 RepID=A0A084W6C7_ANOSI|nr:AGAP006857-PA-like protein [Anopheles sinensis]